ncbi:pyruvate ferredoxin/flavodoxin oxidoreductase family protein [Asticcacaulis biprosthecium C19]|uniref:Pyruvate ferredoxin/flavodoxin oxidoreductase family protein n=1 Tax=Asticcacaulis biprosthecium C19 TaxID=715226 RepID=F4QRT9_9CAUL|nr:indolepyruvate ferredoxin oxidoreductase family protein [Asticcacaulis biprosthecium]EGF89459.1 pyruvate ferredoxin/flavodoxin oxidoreductase family protein [Asticcacaulis biprosthecium C19]
MRAQVTLADKYELDSGRAFMTGVQALVRLPMLIRERDRKAGLNTAGFISGYRGSPLGTYDMQLSSAQKLLDAHDIVVQRGINEDLGATAVWGTQHVPLFQGAKKDGVFGLWYGKGPGVDRTGDVFKHANLAGTSQYGGVLALAGDDHSCKSSTLANQSEFAFLDAEMPTLAPATIDEVIDFGMKGIALSRYSGCWIGLKTIADLMDASTSAHIDPTGYTTVTPDFDLPEGGLNIRLNDPPEAKEIRHRHYRLPAAQAFARANNIDRIVSNSSRPRFGIAATGKGFLHALDALRLLGIGDSEARDLGLRLWKIGLVWPLDPEAATAFADGLEFVLVVEERRNLIEYQLRDVLYTLPDGRRPRILGKNDAAGKPLIRDTLDLDTGHVALALYDSLPEGARTEARAAVAARLRQQAVVKDNVVPLHTRKPFFCAGCPHNTSTTVPEGSRATAGIGCHYMVQFMPNRNSEICTHMGGEGVTWVGQAPFTEENHIFANLGDGTYFHSGLLAIRQAVAAGVNMTYKILYNDAVAMTGGQHVDGQLHPVTVAQQVAAEGVTRIMMVSDNPDRWRGHPKMPAKVSFWHRDDMPVAEEELRNTPGTTVLIFDQMCATELRRRRKRGLAPKAKERIFINPAVCEGCGDCSAKSNCIAVGPKETDLGRKREIDQSACNIDTSCVKGFCPSFVSLDGAQLKKAQVSDVDAIIADLPEITPPQLSAEPYNILLTGIGGLGVTSLSAMVGMAAHLDAIEVLAVDQIGLAQRGGAVDAHIRLAAPGAMLPGGRIPFAEADVLIAADMVTAHGKACLPLMDAARTKGFLNSALTPTAEFTLNTETKFDSVSMLRRVKAATRDLNAFDASGLSRKYLGDAVYTIMVVLGAAWQAGTVPLSRAAIEKAIELNGAEVKSNLRAFALGRAFVAGRLNTSKKVEETFDLDAFIAARMTDLEAYQDEAYARDYKALVDIARKAEAKFGTTTFTEAVARYAFKLKAYKDEYEVARLYLDPAFRAQLAAQFENPDKVSVFLAPPLFGEKDAHTGLPKKRKFGPWIFKAFAVLSALKGLRGTTFDIFGYSEERRMERRLIGDYAQLINRLARELAPHNFDLAVALARLPEDIRGFGHIKQANHAKARTKWTELLTQFEAAQPPKPYNDKVLTKEVAHV